MCPPPGRASCCTRLVPAHHRAEQCRPRRKREASAKGKPPPHCGHGEKALAAISSAPRSPTSSEWETGTLLTRRSLCIITARCAGRLSWPGALPGVPIRRITRPSADATTSEPRAVSERSSSPVGSRRTEAAEASVSAGSSTGRSYSMTTGARAAAAASRSARQPAMARRGAPILGCLARPGWLEVCGFGLRVDGKLSLAEMTGTATSDPAILFFVLPASTPALPPGDAAPPPDDG